MLFLLFSYPLFITPEFGLPYIWSAGKMILEGYSQRSTKHRDFAWTEFGQPVRCACSKWASCSVLTSVKVCWACFCYCWETTMSASWSDLHLHNRIKEWVDSFRTNQKSTYQVPFALIEGLDSVVQFLYGNRHPAPKVGDGAFCTTQSSTRYLGSRKNA